MDKDTEGSITCSKSVLLFKAPKEGEEDPYVKEFSGNGYTATCIPVLEFAFINITQYSELLQQPFSFSAIVFTSQRSVEATIKAICHLEDEDQTLKEKKHGCLDIRCYVVGSSTLKAAEEAGFTPVESDCGNANNLVDFISKDLPSSDKPLLYPCGNLRQDTVPNRLTQLGYKLNEIVVYDTIKNPFIESMVESTIKLKGLPDYVVYFSPSGVEYTYPHMLSCVLSFNQSKVIAIGPSTQKALEQKGIPISGVSKKPDAKTLLETIRQIDDT